MATTNKGHETGCLRTPFHCANVLPRPSMNVSLKIIGAGHSCRMTRDLSSRSIRSQNRIWNCKNQDKKNPGEPGLLQQQAMDQVPTPVFDLPQPAPELAKLQVTDVVPADGVMVTIHSPTPAVPVMTMAPVAAVCVSAEI